MHVDMLRGQFTSPGANKVTHERILALKIVVESDSHISLCVSEEHDLGPLGHNRPISHSKVAHVV